MDSHMDAKVLRRAAELIDQGHCKHDVARNATGKSCGLRSPDAVAWCIVGARIRAEYDILGEQVGYDWAIEDALGMDAVTWNNAPERTADEVADALREAAARCESA